MIRQCGVSVDWNWVESDRSLHVDGLGVGFPRAETGDPQLITLRAKWEKVRACKTQQNVSGGD